MAGDVRDERLAQIGQRALPLIALHPGDRIVGPDAEPRRSAGVILLSDVREVDVRQAVLRIEREDETSVADQ